MLLPVRRPPTSAGPSWSAQPRETDWVHTPTIQFLQWMDEILHHLRNHGKPQFVGSYSGIITPGFLRWCRISSVHSMFLLMPINHKKTPKMMPPPSGDVNILQSHHQNSLGGLPKPREGLPKTVHVSVSRSTNKHGIHQEVGAGWDGYGFL